MRDTDLFSELQRRHLVQISAALRPPIHDELEYDLSGFAPFDAEVFEEMSNTIYVALTELMFAAYAEEATAIHAQCAEAAERLEEEWVATTWRLDVGDEMADWLDDLDKDGQ
jgi:hypothetical protein